MIRRGFWLLLGAAIGVSGYRRASRLAQSITGSPQRRRALLDGRDAAAARADRDSGEGGAVRGAGFVAFLRDVHEGMAEYLDRHPPRSGHTLGSQREPGQLPGRAGKPAAEPGTQRAKEGR